ncbi:MAG: M15 family metallopeptidase [Acidimicrobiales bacterium]
MLLAQTGCTAESDGGQQSVNQAPASEALAEPTLTTTTAASTVASTSTATSAADSTETSSAVEDAAPVAVVLRLGGIDDAFVESLLAVDGLNWVSLVERGQVHLKASSDAAGNAVDAPPDGFVIQLEAVAHGQVGSVERYAPELVEALGSLGERELILSRSSAELRRLDVGSTITFDNQASFDVAAIVEDSVVGTSEVVFGGSEALSAAGGGSSSRQLAFVGYDGTGSQLEGQLLQADGGSGIRVFGGRDNGERDRQRTTLSAIEVKKIFGEFAFRPIGGSAIEIDPAWTEANLVTADLPLLGPARCHRVFAEILIDVLQSLIDDGLEDVIDPGAFQGCWNPRRIAGSSRVSKHSWGMAADINFGNSLEGGPGSPVHPELLKRMLAADVISGHLWTASPDPGHFEYRGP